MAWSVHPTARLLDESKSDSYNISRMNLFRSPLEAVGLAWLALAALLIQPPAASAAKEQTFPLLRIGAQVYTNVTVTTKAKNYIFILHAGGMNNIKIADLPEDVREKLGYPVTEKLKPGTNGPAAWAKAEVARIETPRLKEMRTKLEQRLRANNLDDLSLKALLGSRRGLAAAGIALVIYLFHCYCFLLICRKAGHPPGPLVWVPLLQFFPLLRAAGMSPWWFLAGLLPLLNIIAFVVWSVQIAKARGKSGWTAFFLILPITYFLAFLYLAFSDGRDPGMTTAKSKGFVLR